MIHVTLSWNKNMKYSLYKAKIVLIISVVTKDMG